MLRERRAQRVGQRRALASDRGRARRPTSGNAAGDARDRSDGAVLEALADDASAPMKTSSPVARYGATRSNGASETFIPTRLGARSRSSSITATGTVVAAAVGVLVDVERERRARGGRGGEVLEKLDGVEARSTAGRSQRRRRPRPRAA